MDDMKDRIAELEIMLQEMEEDIFDHKVTSLVLFVLVIIVGFVAVSK